MKVDHSSTLDLVIKSFINIFMLKKQNTVVNVTNLKVMFNLIEIQSFMLAWVKVWFRVNFFFSQICSLNINDLNIKLFVVSLKLL